MSKRITGSGIRPFLLLLLLAAAPPAKAQTYIWDGDLSGNWNTAGNWFSGVPVSNVNSILSFGASSHATLNNNIPLASFLLNQVQFDSAAAAYSIGGNALDFRNNGSGTAPSINVDGGAPLTFTLPMTFTNTLRLTGTGIANLDLNGVLSGAGGLLVDRAGNTFLGNGSNTYSGTTTISGGSLVLTNAGAIPAGNNVVVNSGGTLNLGTISMVTSQALDTITVNGGGTLRVASGNGNLLLNTLHLDNGDVNTQGAGAFSIRFFDSGASLYAATAATMTGSSSSRIINDTFAPLPINVNAGAFGGSLTVGMQLSSSGNNPNFTKIGGGTLILQNSGNTGNLQLDAGTIRFDNVNQLGSGTLTLRNGNAGASLAYNGSANSTVAKAISVGSGGARFSVSPTNRLLTYSGQIAESIAQQPIFITGSFDADNPAGISLTNSTNNLGGTFTISGGGLLSLPTISVAGNPQPAGQGVPAGARKFILGDANSNGILRLTGNAGTYSTNYGLQAAGTRSFPFQGNGTIDIVNASTNLFLTRGIIGPGGNEGVLFKTGPGSITLNGAGSEVTSAAVYVFDGKVAVGANGKVLNDFVFINTGGTFDTAGFTNTTDATQDYVSVAIDGGILRTSSGAADYRFRLFSITGGGVNTINSTTSSVTIFGAPGGDSPNTLYCYASPITSIILGSATSKFVIEGPAPSMVIEQGTTSSGVDLGIGIILSSRFNGVVEIQKLGFGTLQLVNENNEASLRIRQGRLQVNDVLTAGVGGFGTGKITFDGGTFQYGGSSATVGKTLDLGAGGGTFEITNPIANLTLDTTRIREQGGLTKAGPGTLTLTQTNPLAFAGGITVAMGVVQAAGPANLGAANSVVTVQPGGGLVFTANATVSKTFQLTSGSLGAAAGTTTSFHTSNVYGGYLVGNFATVSGGATAFIGGTTTTSTTLSLSGGGTLINFTNGGQLTVPIFTAPTFTRLTNASSGRITIGGVVAVTDFVNDGQVTIGAALQNYGVVNVTAGAIYAGGGSVTTIASPFNPVGKLNLNGNTLEVMGGLVINNGVPTTFTPPNAGIVGGTTRVNYGALAKGNGYYDNVETLNGGQYSPGNSPGLGLVGTFNINPGGSYLFEINDAAGVAGPTGGQTLGWDKTNVLSAINFTATPANRFTVNLRTLLPSSGDNSGPMQNWDPNLPHTWLAFEGIGSAGFNGTLNADAFNINTAQFANPINGTFSMQQDGALINLVYSPVPEPGLLLVVGLLAWRRFRK